MLNSKDISFVVQGPILWNTAKSINLTQIVCESIRLYYPKSEIVLSTWEGHSTENMTYDNVFINVDPGFNVMTLNGVTRDNNTNRMIVSTYNGVNTASRKYVFRIRSDLVITYNNLLNLDVKLIEISQDPVFFNRVIILPTLKRYERHRIIFSFTDWAYFGLKVDLLKLYSLPLMDEHNLIKVNGTASWENNVVSEQYIIKTYFSQFKQFDHLHDFTHMYQYSKKMGKLSNLILKKYFLILDGNQFSGLKSLKHEGTGYLSKAFKSRDLIYNDDWKFIEFEISILFKKDFYLYFSKKIIQFFYLAFVSLYFKVLKISSEYLEKST